MSTQEQTIDLLRLFQEEHGELTEVEIDAIAGALHDKVDVPFRRSEPAPKTILVDKFGMVNAGKTSCTQHIERVFRRRGFNTFCPPETAEIASVRNKSSDSPLVIQARHLTGVQDYVLNLAHSRDFHLSILSRGLIDMLFWYRFGRGDEYREDHYQSVRREILELLRMDLVDAYVYFRCNVDTIMEREFEDSPTKKEGSKTNRSFLEKSERIYEEVLQDVRENVPGLPIVTVDTTDKNIAEASSEILQKIFPILCDRFDVSPKDVYPRSVHLIKRHTKTVPVFEEQLKLHGHPDNSFVESEGWSLDAAYDQRDIYISDPNSVEGEIIRIRYGEDRTQFMYKSSSRHPIFSHRKPLTLDITEEDAQKLQEEFEAIAEVSKYRRCYSLALENNGVEEEFTLHIDTIEGLGEFTEIRIRSRSDLTHSEELLSLATRLGFVPADIIEGSYLDLLLRKK